jgi:hypothetical protein
VLFFLLLLLLVVVVVVVVFFCLFFGVFYGFSFIDFFSNESKWVEYRIVCNNMSKD